MVQDAKPRMQWERPLLYGVGCLSRQICAETLYLLKVLVKRPVHWTGMNLTRNGPDRQFSWTITCRKLWLDCVLFIERFTRSCVERFSNNLVVCSNAAIDHRSRFWPSEQSCVRQTYLIQPVTSRRPCACLSTTFRSDCSTLLDCWRSIVGLWKGGGTFRRGIQENRNWA